MVENCTGLINNLIRKLPNNKVLGTSEILKRVTQLFNAEGCIIWKIKQDANQLYTYADYFVNDLSYAYHELPFESMTGKAILKNKREYVANVYESEIVNTDIDFWESFDIKSFCSVPLVFLNGEKGALNLYCKKESAFIEMDIQKLELLSLIISNLYSSRLDQISFRLFKHFNVIMHDYEDEMVKVNGEKDISNIVSLQKEAYFNTCNCLCEQLGCTMTSIRYLVNSKVVRLFQINGENREVEEVYENPEKEFQTESQLIYDLHENKNLSILSEIKTLFLQEKLEFDKPLSFVSVPIILDNKIIGEIACVGLKNAPYYFTLNEKEILELISQRIGTTLNVFKTKMRLYNDSVSFNSLYNAIEEISGIIHSELERTYPSSIRVFGKILKIISRSIPGAEILDIRLLDTEKEELYFAYFHGDEWKKGTKEEIAARKSRRFSIHGNSAGAKVYQDQKVWIQNDLSKSEHYDKTFDCANGMVICPILDVDGQFIGVIDIRSKKVLSQVPDLYKQMITLVTKQIGLYVSLLEKIKSLRKKDEEIRHTLQDFVHQLKGPIINSNLHLKRIYNYNLLPKNVLHELSPVKGLLVKSYRVASNVELFVSLSKGEAIKISKTEISPLEIRKLLGHIADDHQKIIKPNRNIRINVENSNYAEYNKFFLLDSNMLEQTVNSLVENAVKYSFKNTQIDIEWKQTVCGDDKYLIVTVLNEGIKIKKEEAAKCKMLHYRGEEAKKSSSEGYGIGLWLVESIMNAHGGELIIEPTSSEYKTNISLKFKI